MPRIDIRDEIESVKDTAFFDPGTMFHLAVQHQWPDGFPGMTVIVLDHNKTVVDTAEAAMVPMKADETWTVVLRPQLETAIIGIFGAVMEGVAFGGALGASVTWATVAATAITLVGSYLMRPSVPQFGGDAYNWGDESGPQFFSGQSNRLTPGSRVPCVYGTVRIWPSIISEPVPMFNGKTQTIDEIYAVSEGLVACSQARLYDEAAANLGSVEYYNPGDYFPDDFEVVSSNRYVTSVDLKAPNENEAASSVTTFDTGGTVTSSLENFWTAMVVGEYVALAGAPVDVANRQIYEVMSVSGDGTTMTVSPAPASNQVIDATVDGPVTVRRIDRLVMNAPSITWRDVYQLVGSGESSELVKLAAVDPVETPDPGFPTGYFYNPTVDDGTTKSFFNASWGEILAWLTDTSYVVYRNRYIVGSDAPDIVGNHYYVRFTDAGAQNPDDSNYHVTNNFAVPGDVDRIYWDVEAPNGYYHQIAGEAPTAIKTTVAAHYQKQNADGSWPTTFTTIEHEYSDDATRTGLRWTKYVDVPTGHYRVYFERTRDAMLDQTAAVRIDALRLVGLRGRQVTTDLRDRPLNVTLARLKLDVRDLGQSNVGNRSFSVVAARWLPKYLIDGAPVEYAPAINDILTHIAVDKAGYDLDEIDTQALNDIQADLDAITTSHDEDGSFHGIIDQAITAEDEIVMVCAVGRITPYRRAKTLYFSRNKAGQIPVNMINARNKIEAETRTMTFNQDADPTHVVVRYMNRDDDYKEAWVQYPETPIDDQTSVVVEQSLIGITLTAVAQRTAQSLLDRKLWERDMAEVTVTEDGVLLATGDVVALTDHLISEPVYDGEVIAILDANRLKLDQSIPVGTYMLTVRDQDGNIVLRQEKVKTDDNDQINIPTGHGVLAMDATAQVGHLYSMTPVEMADFDLWRVVAVTPSNDGPVRVSLAQYRDEAYASDAALAEGEN